MGTVKDELERAIPHLDATTIDLDELSVSGRRALRRRRTRMAGVLATSSLVAAGVALGTTAAIGGNDRPADARPSITAHSPATGTTPPTPPATAALRLASLERVAEACGRLSVNADTGALSADGRPVEATDSAEGDGWTAWQYPCGSDLVRILQTGDRSVIESVAADAHETLQAWAERTWKLAQR